MSSVEVTAQQEAKKSTQLGDFLLKTTMVTVAALVVLFGATFAVSSLIEGYAEPLKGGPAFWEVVERKLYALADEPDLPPQKKAKIIKALNKLSTKYHPYLEALAASPKQLSAEK